MDQSLLLCVSEPAYLEDLSGQALSIGFRVEKRSTLPKLNEFEAVFPDLLLLDMAFIGDSPAPFLEQLSTRFPSVETYLLAGSECREEILFSHLKSGVRGWIFKENAEKVIERLSSIVEEKHFFRPFVSQLILEEFKKLSEGEGLLPLEEEILRQSARGVALSQMEQNLNLSSKLLHGHWESIWQKLNINSRAVEQIEERPLPPESSPQAIPVKESRVSENTPKESLHLVTFCLGREEFAFNITDLQEIQKMMPVTPLPRVPSYVLGIVNLRGTIVPIIDLRIKLGLDSVPLSKDARIILVNVEKKLVGVIVDSVREVLRVPSSQLEPPPALVLTRSLKSIKSVLNIQDRLILLLDLKEILLEDARKQDSGFQSVGV